MFQIEYPIMLVGPNWLIQIWKVVLIMLVILSIFWLENLIQKNCELY
jgi:hypothetical protein